MDKDLSPLFSQEPSTTVSGSKEQLSPLYFGAQNLY